VVSARDSPTAQHIRSRAGVIPVLHPYRTMSPCPDADLSHSHPQIRLCARVAWNPHALPYEWQVQRKKSSKGYTNGGGERQMIHQRRCCLAGGVLRSSDRARRVPKDTPEESAEAEECEGGPPRADRRGAGELPKSPAPSGWTTAVGTRGGRDGEVKVVDETTSDVLLGTGTAEVSPNIEENRSPIPENGRETEVTAEAGEPTGTTGDGLGTAAPGPDLGTHGVLFWGVAARRRWK
jgi:hypothetical protein